MSIRTHALIFSLLSSFSLCASAIEIPLQLDSHWHALNYRSIAANSFSQTDKGLRIDVQASASPLIFTFDQPIDLQNIRVTGKMGGLPDIPGGLQQGGEGADDFPFRLGLVLEGDKTLNYAQKLIAPKWVKTLYSLAPAGTGVDHVLFLNLANPGTLNWKAREHPGSKGLFKETIVKHIEANMPFEMHYTLPQSKPVLALWISTDGDDTGSSYSIDLHSISIN